MLKNNFMRSGQFILTVSFFPQLESLWSWITSMLESVLSNFTVETVSDWGNFFLFICVGDIHPVEMLLSPFSYPRLFLYRCFYLTWHLFLF